MKLSIPVNWLALALVPAFLGLATACSSSDSNSSEQESALTWSQLRNATYTSVVSAGSSVGLVDGATPSDEGVMPSARLADIGAFGNLDEGRSVDSVVFLMESTGDTTWKASLVPVLNVDGQPVPQPPMELGDNAFVRAVEIVDEQIVVRYRPLDTANTAADEVSEVTQTYTFEDNVLQLADEATATASIDPPEGFRLVPDVLEQTEVETKVDLTLAPRASAPFVINGSAGQHLEVALDTPFDSGVLSVQGLGDDMQLVSKSAYATTLSADLTVTQGYLVTVRSVAGSGIDISMTYSLTPEEADGGEAPLPVEPPQSVEELALAVPRSAQSSVATPGEPLPALSADASAFIQGRDPSRGIAVVTASGGLLYSENGDEQMETASVIKVVVMTCVMVRAEQQGRYVDEWELSLMWQMITYSDNDATDTLWSDLGGGPGMVDCLDQLGITGITPYQGLYWGTSTASATGMATLMARLTFGELVNPVHRAVALAMLVSVIAEQRWGVPAGADESGLEIVGVKDGWYPDDVGWRVNSVGFISPLSAGPEPYAIAVMANYQSTQEYGIETIEGLALPVYEALRGDGLP